MDKKAEGVWIGYQVAIIAGEIAFTAVMDDRIRIMPITDKLATLLNFPSFIHELLWKHQKEIQDLIDSGFISNAKWLKKHMQFVGSKGADLLDWPEKVLKSIQRQLDHPMAERRLAKVFANAFMDENACATYLIKDLQNVEGFDERVRLLVDNNFHVVPPQKQENRRKEAPASAKVRNLHAQKSGRKTRQFGNGKGIDDAIAKLIRETCQITNKEKINDDEFIERLVDDKNAIKSSSQKPKKKP